MNSDNDYGEEVRLKYRYLDLRRSKMQHNIKLRNNIINFVRGFMNNEGFLEVETPMLHPIPGGANAKPFITKHNALDQEMYLLLRQNERYLATLE